MTQGEAPARARCRLPLPGRPGRAGGHRALFAATALGVAVADQAGKAAAVARGHGIGQDPGGLVRNAGASFGIGAGWTMEISLLTLAAVLVLVTAGLRAGDRGWAVALALMAGGAAGNGTDRLLRAPGPLHGAVVDWISVPGYAAAFNIADLALRGGTLLMLFLLLRTGGAQQPAGSGPHPPAGS